MASIEKLLIVKEVMPISKISRTTLFSEISNGEIAVYKIRGNLSIVEKDINGYIKKKRAYKTKAEICPLEKGQYAIWSKT